MASCHSIKKHAEEKKPWGHRVDEKYGRRDRENLSKK